MYKKKRKVGVGFKFFSIILTIFSLLLILMLVYLNVLSNKLLLIVSSVIIVINVLFSFILLKSNFKKIGVLITSILIFLYSIIGYYLYKTTDFLGDINLNYKTYNYSVVVLKDSDYKTINDISNNMLGYYDEDDFQTGESINRVKKKVSVKFKDYDNTHDMAVSLVNKDIDVILIEDSYLDVIELNEGLLNDLVKKVYSFKIREKIDDNSKDLNVVEKPFNIYLSGIDTFGEITSVSRSDVNMVVTVNPSTKQILLTSIPRDYYVKLHGKSGYPDKLTHAGMYGTEMSIKTIEDLLNIEINYYVKVNFTSVIDIIDELGGVEVYSDYEFISRDNFKYKQGYNKVNGEEALSFVRERKAFVAGDRQRVRNQQAMLNAIFDKCTSKSIITKYTRLLDSLNGSFITNMKMNRLTSLIKLQLTKNYNWEIISNSLDGTDSSNYTFSSPYTKAYVMMPVEEDVEHASGLIGKMLNNEVLNKDEINKTVAVSGGVNVSNDGLSARLIKSNIEIIKGDDYIYNGVTATYNGKDITNSSKLMVTFKVGDKILSDYHELILYISKLDSGSYDIIHNVSYEGKEINLVQKLTIKELVMDTDIDNID